VRRASRTSIPWPTRKESAVISQSKRHQPPEFAPGASPGYMHAAQARRGSGAAGAAGVHGDRRTRRARHRGSAARTAIRASARGE
jgi:hypothetical protein